MDNKKHMTMTFSFSQAVMKEAVEYYIRHVLLKADVSVAKVETAESLGGIDHFNVHLVLPAEE